MTEEGRVRKGKLDHLSVGSLLMLARASELITSSCTRLARAVQVIWCGAAPNAFVLTDRGAASMIGVGESMCPVESLLLRSSKAMVELGITSDSRTRWFGERVLTVPFCTSRQRQGCAGHM